MYQVWEDEGPLKPLFEVSARRRLPPMEYVDGSTERSQEGGCQWTAPIENTYANNDDKKSALEGIVQKSLANDGKYCTVHYE